MHSRIIQLEKEPVEYNDRIESRNIPDWFGYAVADYTADNCDREGDIQWLFNTKFGAVATRSGEKVIFKDDFSEFFKKDYEEFTAVAKRLSESSFEDFAKGRPLEVDMGLLKEAFNDKYGFYIYSDDNLHTLNHFLRYDAQPNEVYYLGGVVDYHY